VSRKANGRLSPELQPFAVVEPVISKQLVIRLSAGRAGAVAEVPLSQCETLTPVRVPGMKVPTRTDTEALTSSPAMRHCP
jgi:hypothetical protein